MSLVPQLVPLAQLAPFLAPQHCIGAGTMGEVFAASLPALGAVAVRRLALRDSGGQLLASMPAGARPHLERHFRAELLALSAYQHPRLARLLGYSVDPSPSSAAPFFLVFELMEQRSLADWLQRPDGAPPPPLAPGGAPPPPLTALQRLDIALGCAQGLAYLHGQAGAAEGSGSGSGGGGGVDGGGGTAPPDSPRAPPLATPALHRDVKAANLGLSGSGAQLHSKLLDYGLCRAVKPGAVGAPPLPGALQGSPGYMPPELLRGQYTPASEVYSLGCVLLELASGRLVAPDTAFRFKRLARRSPAALLAPEGAALAQYGDAGAAWPPAALASLLALASACLEEDPEDRPPSMRACIERLAGARALAAAGSGGGSGGGGSGGDGGVGSGGAEPLELCCVCLEDCPASQGLRCKSGAHFICAPCLQDHIVASTEASVLAQNGGALPCPARCGSAPWSLEELVDLRCASGQGALGAGALKRVLRGLSYLALDVPRLRREHEEGVEAARLAALAAAGRGERLALERRRVVEEVLTLRCPGCHQAFLDHTHCEHLQCESVPGVKVGCGTHFCGLCLAPFGSGSATLQHVALHARAAGEAHRAAGGDSYHFTSAEFEAAHRVRREGLVAQRLRELAAGEGAGAGAGLAKDLLQALAADLQALHMSVEKIGALVLQPEGGAAAAQGGAQQLDAGAAPQAQAQAQVQPQGPLAVGSRVEGNYRGWGHWYRGAVSALGPNATCSIQYDDGDREEGVPPARVRRDPPAEEWECSACTLRNPSAAPACVLCQSPRALRRAAPLEAPALGAAPGAGAQAASAGAQAAGAEGGRAIVACRAFAAGDSVLYNGAPCRVLGLTEEGRAGYFRVSLALREESGGRVVERASYGMVSCARRGLQGVAEGGGALALGSEVIAPWGQGGGFYSACVTALNPGGDPRTAVTVAYKDGLSGAPSLPADRVFLVPAGGLAPPAGAAAAAAAAIGAAAAAAIPAAAAAAAPAAAAAAAGAPLAVGDRVEGNFRAWGHWYRGVVSALGPNATCSIQYDDGDREEGVPPARVRRQPGEAAPRARYRYPFGEAHPITLAQDALEAEAEGRPLAVGDLVEIHVGYWSAGRVVLLRPDGTMDVAQQSGEFEVCVPPARVRRYLPAGHVPPRATAAKRDCVVS